MQKSIISSYLLILGALIGIEIAAGAFVAPVIFYASNYIGEGVLSHFQSGILMTQVFLKYNLTLMLCIVLMWLMELYMYKIGKKDMLSFILLIGICISGGLFVFYYTPFILQAQKLGESMLLDPQFQNMHKASEIDIKALILLQIMLLFRKVWIVCK